MFMSCSILYFVHVIYAGTLSCWLLGVFVTFATRTAPCDEQQTLVSVYSGGWSETPDWVTYETGSLLLLILEAEKPRIKVIVEQVCG